MKRLWLMAMLIAVLLSSSGVWAKRPAPPPPPPNPYSIWGTATVLNTKGDLLYNKVIQTTSTPDYAEYYGVTGGGISYVPLSSIGFQDIYELSVDWKAVTFFGGGSPRIALAIDVDGDGQFLHYAYGGNDAWVCVYLLQAWPIFYDNPSGTWTRSGNLIGATTGIWDLTQFGGPSGYNGYDLALTMLSGYRVLKIIMVTDGGWLFGWEPGPDAFTQVVWANNFRVNADVLNVSGR